MEVNRSRTLAFEIFKTINDISPNYMKNYGNKKFYGINSLKRLNQKPILVNVRDILILDSRLNVNATSTL